MIFSGYLDERTSVYEAIRCCFFDSLETKSIDELRALSTKYGENVVNYLAQSYTEEGSTPLLLAIRYERLDLVKFLMEELEARLNQTGRFVWEEEEYEDVPPLFAAVIAGQLSITKYLTSHEFLFCSYELYLPRFSTSKNRLDKIDVLELMGAAYILVGEDSWGIRWQFWEEALKLREHVWLQNRSMKIELAERTAFNITVIALKKFHQIGPSERSEFQNCLSLFIDQGWKSSQLPAKIITWVYHLHSCDSEYFMNPFLKSDCIRLLLDAGVDPNVVDESGDTPLVILANERLKINIKCIKMMLDAGTHIDQANSSIDFNFNQRRDSALEILKSRLHANYSGIFPLINVVLPLKCLCANVIRQNRIPFEKLPRSLESFVGRHSREIPISRPRFSSFL